MFPQHITDGRDIVIRDIDVNVVDGYQLLILTHVLFPMVCEVFVDCVYIAHIRKAFTKRRLPVVKD